MIRITITYLIATLAAAALGYYWGYHDKEDEYVRGLETGATFARASLAMLNHKIRDLEEENDLLRIRLGDETNTELENQYLHMEDKTE